MLIRKISAVFLSLLVLGCDDQSAHNRSGPDAGMVVAADDKEMTAAIAQARARIPEFLDALQRGASGRSHFSIKAKYEHHSGAEYVWISDISYNGKVYVGRVDNEPRDIKTIKFGDMVTIQPGAVSDWLYVEDGRLVGAFTLRVIYLRMPPAQQQSFRQQFPHKFEW